MIPVARTEKLFIQEVGNDVIVYDQKSHASHSLNAMAAKIWELCDGHNTIDNIAQLLEEEFNLPVDEDTDIRGLIWLTLEELEHFQLIKEYRTQPITDANISRRKVVKTATILGGFAIGSMFPVVRSIVAPAPAMAQSSKPTPKSCGYHNVTQPDGTVKKNVCFGACLDPEKTCRIIVATGLAYCSCFRRN